MSWPVTDSKDHDDCTLFAGVQITASWMHGQRDVPASGMGISGPPAGVWRLGNEAVGFRTKPGTVQADTPFVSTTWPCDRRSFGLERLRRSTSSFGRISMTESNNRTGCADRHTQCVKMIRFSSPRNSTAASGRCQPDFALRNEYQLILPLGNEYGETNDSRRPGNRSPRPVAP